MASEQTNKRTKAKRKRGAYYFTFKLILSFPVLS